MSNADARFWDQIAESYAKKPFPNPDATARKLALVRARCKPADRLLDIGCGTGTLTLDLAPGLAEAHGVDISAAMIELARAKPNPGNVTFHVRPAGGLEGFDGFDQVLAFNVLHLVDHPLELLRAIRRAMAPGGTLFSSTPCLGGVWLPPYALILPILQRIGRAPSVTLFSRAELADMARQAGFTELEFPDVGDSSTNAFLVARV